MNDKILFSKTYLNRRSNGTNKAYWTKYIKTLLTDESSELLFHQDIDSFDDCMPIFNCLYMKNKRGLIIYQYNPSLLSHKDNNFARYITAWTSQRWFNGKRISILTIAMISSFENVRVVKELIKLWMNKKKGVNDMIKRIYENQD